MIAALGRAAGLVLAAALALFAQAAVAAPRFPPLTGRVVDAASVLSPGVETQLTQELADLEARTSRQVVVATVPDLQGYEIEDFGYQLGRAWGIGRKDQDDGVVFLIAPKERAVRIEVGYGLEPVLTDALSNVILQERVLPAFRDGRIEAGVVAGTQAIVQQLSLPDDQAKAQVAQASAPQDQSSGGGVPIVFIIFIVIWVLGGLTGAFRGRGGRSNAWWLLPWILSGGGGGGGRGGGFGGGGGFSGGGGSFGGGGSSGRW